MRTEVTYLWRNSRAHPHICMAHVIHHASYIIHHTSCIAHHASRLVTSSTYFSSDADQRCTVAGHVLVYGRSQVVYKAATSSTISPANRILSARAVCGTYFQDVRELCVKSVLICYITRTCHRVSSFEDCRTAAA